jgi:hypothetical protein
VTILLIVVASLTPRRIRKANAQTPAVDSTSASNVSPSPSAGTMPPTVDMMSTQYVTLPTHALAQ